MNDSIQFVQVLFLVGIFIIEKRVEFSLSSFGILNYDSVIKTIEKLNFLPPINNSVTL